MMQIPRLLTSGAIALAAAGVVIITHRSAVALPTWAIAQAVRRDDWLRGIPLGLGVLSVISALLLALVGLYLYRKQQRWRRVNFARQEAKAFRERGAVRNVLDILDYEEFRRFFIVHPETGQQLSFEATDARLQRALRSHDQMSKTRAGLNEIQRLSQKEAIRPELLAVVERYGQEEFFIELTLRDWFDSFLGGLEYFETLIETGLITAGDIRPFIIYWIQLIGDRRYRRKGGSGFYDQLSHYIYWAGYTGVQRLFERYGFKVLPPPYTGQDFADLGAEIGDELNHHTARALSLAKAAHLVYEDQEYVNDIVDLWLSRRQENLWMGMSPREYLVDVIRQWQQEGQIRTETDLSPDFKYIDILTTDTQAFFFRQGEDIVLVFRGSQQLKDWKTNFKIRLQEFTVLADQTAVLPKGRVHRGFLEAWHSVENMVVHYLRKWWVPGQTRLWITGHSLGGALANMAALSLEYQGFEVSGLYTFGQPRIADWWLVWAANKRLGDRIFRYANNNDAVPLIPPQILPWIPSRVYGHMGKFRYFSWNGELRRHPFIGKYWLDRLIGFGLALRQSGFDAINDHKMEFYVAHLQAALDKEAEMAKIAQEKERLKGYGEKEPI